MDKTSNKKLHMDISIKTWQELKKIGSKKGLTVASIVRLVLSEYVEKENKANE